MCGICGFITNKHASAEQHQQDLSRMLELLVTRGPDDIGSYHKHPAHIGMRRLAVLDIEGGHQPLIDEQTLATIVYNGELYNYLELKKDLAQSGIKFRTNSDTEVLLQSYLHHHHDCWAQFNGMFAAAIWEPDTRQLTLARDRLGQKPLYYISRPGFFAFASDIRSLLMHPAVQFELNTEMLPAYLQHRHIPGSTSIIKHIKQLAPGCVMVVDRDLNTTSRRYWQARYDIDTTMGLSEFKEQFNHIWPNAIKRHLLSDVPVGGFLSGGIDSSLISMEASQQHTDFKTLSMGFNDPDFDESHWARQIADLCGCEHQEYNFSGSLQSILPLWERAYDQPFSDPAAFPLLMLCQQARKQMTVALSGDGADELFGGYQRYRSLLTSNRIRNVPKFLRSSGSLLLRGSAKLIPARNKLRRYLDAVCRRLQLMHDDIYQEYINQFHLFDTTTLHSILGDPSNSYNEFVQPSNTHLLPNILQHDLQHWLPDQMLVKTDRASMGVSLETRLPFLDNEIVDLALRTPHELLINKSTLKYALRSVASQSLPIEIAQRAKHGFAVPVDQWLRDEPEFVQDTIRHGIDKSDFMFKSAHISNLLDQHFNGQRNHGEQLLTLLLFFVWKDRLSNLLNSKGLY